MGHRGGPSMRDDVDGMPYDLWLDRTTARVLLLEDEDDNYDFIDDDQLDHEYDDGYEYDNGCDAGVDDNEGGGREIVDEEDMRR